MDALEAFGGTFPLNMIGVADDGVVYAANLSASLSTVDLKIYRWDDDGPDTISTVAFEGDPAGIDDETGSSFNAQRWGDSFAVIGSGTDTRLVLGARASSAVAVFTTSDGEEFEPTVINGVGNGSGNLGITFESPDTLYANLGNAPLRRAVIDLAAASATSQSIPTSNVAAVVSPIAVDPEAKLLAGIRLATGPDSLLLYDISDPTAPVLLSEATFPYDEGNSNGVGAVDFGTDVVYALDTNNGLHAFSITDTGEVLPPEITGDLVNLRVIEGGEATFGVTAAGSPPLAYSWTKDGVVIAGAESSQLILPSVTDADVAEYQVTVSNAAGNVESGVAALEVVPRTQSGDLAQAWAISNDDRDYLAEDNAQRGLSVNPTNGNVVLVSRTGGVGAYVLAGETGADVRELNTESDLISGGGIFPLNMIGVADDGAIYACNLSLSGAEFTIYRWESDAEDVEPEIVWGPEDPGIDGRIGDNFDVRGSGNDTEIIAASRSANTVAIFTTDDGTTFEPTVIDTDANGGDFGLSVSFGEGATFWGKALNRPLRHIAYDLTEASGTTVTSYSGEDFPDSVSIINVNPTLRCLAAISLETPDNLQIYSIADPSIPPVLLDQVFFTTDLANGNGVGSIGFGGGRVVALDTNNGILAATLGKEAPDAPVISLIGPTISTVDGNLQIQFELAAPNGTFILERSTDLVTWSEEDDLEIDASPTQISYPVTEGEAYYRVRPE